MVLNTLNGFFYAKFDPTFDILQFKSHYFYSNCQCEVVFMLTRRLRGRRMALRECYEIYTFQSRQICFKNTNFDEF